MRISLHLAYTFVNSNTYLLSIILPKSVFNIVSIFSIYHLYMSFVQEKFISLIIDAS